MKPLFQVTVLTSPEAEEGVAALLEKHLGLTPTVCFSEITRRSAVTAYLETAPRSPHSLRTLLRQGLRHLASCGLETAPGRITMRPLPRENWAESWKRHFKPLHIGGRLLLLPSWIQRQPKAGQDIIVLDPGLSFGTGHHATTRFCLEQLVCCQPSQGKTSFLDIGCGSGILAIAAAKLGFHPVHAFDYDPEAVRVSKANAQVNQTDHAIRFARKDLTRMPLQGQRSYQVIGANLMADLLIQESRKITNLLAPGGTLILAGILKTQFADVRNAYVRLGLNLEATGTGREWQSGRLRKP